MPLHDVGYRSWKGSLTSAWTRWWTISEVGVRAALASRWIRRIILASWFPVIYFGILFFAFETMMETSFRDLARQTSGTEFLSEIQLSDEVSDAADQVEQIQMLRDRKDNAEYKVKSKLLADNPMIRRLPNAEVLVASLESGDESQLRRTVWGYLLSTFLRYSQGMMTLMIVGLVVPPLISRDVRSRAFLLYYSRPITRMEYLIGKIAIPGFVLSLVKLVPGLVLYFLALMLSPDLSVIADTWDLPFRVIAATVVCIVPTCLIGLLFSALTQESRFASFAWFTVWGLGAVVWFGIYGSNSQGGTIPFDSNWSLISIYSTIGRVQSWIFGLEMNVSQVVPSIVTLVGLSLFSFVLLYRRISAPIRV